MWRCTVHISLLRTPYPYLEFCPRCSADFSGCKLRTRERADGARSSTLRPARPARSPRHAAITPSPRRYRAGACARARARARWRPTDPGLPPQERGEGPEASLRRPVAKRQGFYKPHRGSPASLPPFFYFSVTESSHHVGPRSRQLAKHLSLVHGGGRAAVSVRRVL